MSSINLPLVSIGIPTYQRPNGLYNTLSYLTQQTYKNLEIIISDNCSLGDETRIVVEKFMSDFPYIKYFRQDRNIGIVANFKFVLEKASGEYFMWAADDDEWSNNFVEECLNHSLAGSSVMTGFVTHYRKNDLRVDNRLPDLNSNISPYQNIKSFLNCMQPSLFYGLHTRENILFYLDDEPFYFYDCYFVIKLILNTGFETLPNQVLYSAGIDNEYVIKQLSAKKLNLEYWSFFKSVVILVVKSEKTSLLEKIKLIKDISVVVLRLIIFHEKLLNANWKTMYQKLSSLFCSVARRVYSAWLKTQPLSSYSQSGEDVIIRFIFNAIKIKNPTYLDIGAYHAVHFSNTYLFYKNGSSGVCIEPDPELFYAFKRKRPRDVCINAGVGVNEIEKADFYVLSTKTLNTFSKSDAEKCEEYGQKIEKVIPVALIKVNDILDNYFAGKAPNFISLDVEGLDYEVIKTFDFTRFRPEVFCIETLTYSENRTAEKVNKIIEHMKSKDYFVYGDTYINTIFVDKNTWSEY